MGDPKVSARSARRDATGNNGDFVSRPLFRHQFDATRRALLGPQKRFCRLATEVFDFRDRHLGRLVQCQPLLGEISFAVAAVTRMVKFGGRKERRRHDNATALIAGHGRRKTSPRRCN